MFYEIYDVRKWNLVDDLPFIQAVSAREALIKYIREYNIKVESNSGYKVDFKIRPFHYVGCYRFSAGKHSCFKIVS